MHVGPIRALLAVLGVEVTARGLAIAPRVPAERWTVRMPRLWLEHAPDRFAGRAFASVEAPVELRVRLPIALRGAPVSVTVDGSAAAAAIDGDDVVFTVTARDGGTPWAISAE